MNDQTEHSSQVRGCPVAHHGSDLTRLYGPEAATDPGGIYERLRKEHGSVAPVLLEGDIPAWLVLGYRDSRRVLENPLQFPRDARTWRDLREGRVADDSPLVPMLAWRPDCVSQDGEAHRRLRRAVNDALQSAAGRGVRRHAMRFANKQIDTFADSGRADLVADYADIMPMIVVARVLGLAEAEGRRLVESCAQVMKGGEDAVLHDGVIKEILGELAERRRSEPGSDLATGLLEHHAGLDHDEVVSHLRAVLIAAHVTTNLLARVLELVLTDASRLSGLISGQLNISAVVEEAMWNSPPLAVLPGRFAVGDVELGGHRIEEGDLLVLGLAPGNLDPEVRPESGVSVHGNQAHLAFGAGPHECPGQNIGMAVIEIAVDVLLHRLPGLRLAVPPEELTSTASTWMSLLDSLPVEFDV
ncbi:cytochrome P450 [Streptomyces sp. NRRL B-1140]|uniref:cytochrome P450 n=1 Tax=Streptomyces sp. NRRL B-1140 TaxID=1415549 RepID=UPI0006AE4A28|nr:cytochrome P450 [Streptomyces sp. NRRL B-1140]KOV96908.1 cytochrome P450 [Streptomyces sp. NRRL B-1140]